MVAEDGGSRHVGGDCSWSAGRRCTSSSTADARVAAVSQPTQTGLTADVSQAVFAQIPCAFYNETGLFSKWSVPCNTTADLAFVIGNTTFPMLSQDLAYHPMKATTEMCDNSFAERTRIAIGDPFLRNIAAFFGVTPDTGDFYVAFAEPASPNTNALTPSGASVYQDSVTATLPASFISIPTSSPNSSPKRGSSSGSHHTLSVTLAPSLLLISLVAGSMAVLYLFPFLSSILCSAESCLTARTSRDAGQR